MENHFQSDFLYPMSSIDLLSGSWSIGPQERHFSLHPIEPRSSQPTPLGSSSRWREQCSWLVCLLEVSRETFFFINTWNNNNKKTLQGLTTYFPLSAGYGSFLCPGTVCWCKSDLGRMSWLITLCQAVVSVKPTISYLLKRRNAIKTVLRNFLVKTSLVPKYSWLVSLQ